MRDWSFMGRTPFDDLDDSDVLTAKEIADRLRIDARSVRRAISRGELLASRTCGLRVSARGAAEADRTCAERRGSWTERLSRSRKPL